MSAPSSLASRASQVPRSPVRTRSTAALRTLKAMAATGLMVVPLWSLFTNHGWLLDMWLAIAIVTVPAAIIRSSQPVRVWQTWLGVIVLVPWLTARFLRAHALGGLLPSGSTWSDVSHLFDQVRSLSTNGVAPVHANLAVSFVLSLLGGLIAAFVDLIAVVGRRSAIAGVPILVVFTVVGAVTRHPVNWLLFVASAVAFLILLSLESGDTVHEWGRIVQGDGPQRSTSRLGVSGPRIALVAIAVAAVVPLIAPSRPSNLLSDAVHGSGKGSGVAGFGAKTGISLDPYAALKGQLIRSKPVSLFTVTVRPGDPLPMYLRANVLSAYTARGWGAAAHPGEVDVAQTSFDTYPPVTAPLDTQALHAHIQITNLSDNVPVLAQPAALSGVPHGTLWSNTDQIVIGTTVQKGDRIDEDVLQPNPSLAQLRGAPDTPSYPLDEDLQVGAVPPFVRNLVDRLLQNAQTTYDKARALIDYFTAPGNGFTYSLQTGSGDSGSDLQDFLTNKRGYCQQFAGALAAMMRVGGIPARVVLGYTHGAPNAAGTFMVTTNNAHAWVEAYFEGLGWIPFDPTPAAGSQGGSTQTWAWQKPQAAGGATATPTTSASNSASAAKQKLDTSSAPPVGTAIGSKPSATPWSGIDVGLGLLVLIALALLPAMVRWRRRLARLHAGRQGDVDSIWDELSATARDLGYVWSGSRTPRQVVGWLGPQVPGPAEGSLRTLAGAVERARYAASGSGQSDPLIGQLRDVEGRLRARRSRSARLRARLWPASLGWQLPRGRREH